MGDQARRGRLAVAEVRRVFVEGSGTAHAMDARTPRGNIEGTQAWVRASPGGHSSLADFLGFRDVRARGFPLLPSLPASSLNGKEGVDGSSPSEGLKSLQIEELCCLFRRGPDI